MTDGVRKSEIPVGQDAEEWKVAKRHELFNRVSERQPHAEALDQFQIRMAACTINYESEGDDGRSGAIWALTEAIEYFVGQGLPYAVLEPLTAIGIAFRDAAQGKRPPLFKTTSKGRGGLPKRYLVQEQNGMMAAILDIYFQDFHRKGRESPLESAARPAANLIKKSMGVEITPKELIKKRESVASQEAGKPAREIFKLYVARANASQHPMKWMLNLARSGARPRNPIG